MGAGLETYHAVEVISTGAPDRLGLEEVVRHLLDAGGDRRRVQHLLGILEYELRTPSFWVGLVETDNYRKVGRCRVSTLKDFSLVM